MIIQSEFPQIAIPENISFAHFLFRKWEEFPDQVALVDSVTEQQYTFRELKDLSIKFGSALWRRGVRKGDVVCVVSPNCVEYAICFLATTSIGAILTDVNPSYTSDEIIRQLRDSDVSVFITDTSQLEKVHQIRKVYKSLKDVIFIGQPLKGCASFSHLLEDDGSCYPHVEIRGKEDVALLPYSSGTTGLPKGVRLSHYNIIANTLQICQPWSLLFSDQGRQLTVALQPFYHASGKTVTLANCLYRGATVVIQPKFEYHRFLKLVEKYRATFIFVPPPILIRMEKDPGLADYDLSSLQILGVGSAPVAHSVMVNLVKKMALPNITQGYGMTEGTCVSTTTPIGIPKYGSIGKLISNTQVKIVDVNTGESLGAGEDGELWMRGPQVMLGYLNKPKATADTLDPDGWLHTGDIGHYDEDGYFYIVDRLKELIKYKGFQVAPAEIESVLLGHDAVQDVAVVAVPDERAGQVPKAYVVLKPNKTLAPQLLVEYSAGKLAPYKKIRGGVEFIKEIPKSASGKILRKTLQQKIAKSKL